MPIITIESLSKQYKSATKALQDCSMEIKTGEILALLGENGAGKTTLISIICSIVRPTSGKVVINGYDIVKDYRLARESVGLVPQELTLPVFDKVISAVSYTRALFGKKENPAYIEKLLRDLSLWDKRNSLIMQLSGGMKRRVLIAKALAHEPKVLFLDEPTAGVDVGLRKDMWQTIMKLRDAGTTIILTTHYLEEAEMLADRIGIMHKGELLLLETKEQLMRKFGSQQMYFDLAKPLQEIPNSLSMFNMTLAHNGTRLIYHYSITEAPQNITPMLTKIIENGINITKINTKHAKLEDIFVTITKNKQ